MSAQIYHKKNKKVHLLIGITVALIIFISAYFSFAYSQSLWPFIERVGIKFSDDKGEINYNPPTSEEIQEGQDAKKRIIETDEDNEEFPSSVKTTVSVGVAFADVVDGNLEIRAFTPSVIEGDGLCRAILKKDDVTITESSLAFIDSTTSQCRPIYISVERFKSKGTWSLIVSYTSDTSIGESPSMEVNI